MKVWRVRTQWMTLKLPRVVATGASKSNLLRELITRHDWKSVEEKSKTLEKLNGFGGLTFPLKRNHGKPAIRFLIKKVVM